MSTCLLDDQDIRPELHERIRTHVAKSMGFIDAQDAVDHFRHIELDEFVVAWMIAALEDKLSREAD